MKRISSVSGGSITAAMLALKWPALSCQSPDVQGLLVPNVVKPIRQLADTTIDASSIIRGLLLPGSITKRIAKAYRNHLYARATLQDFPDEPRFVINATNVQSGALWRFMKPYMRDYRVGEVKKPDIEVAVAVGASSAFPPVLSPVCLELDPSSFTPDSGKDLQEEPFTSKVVLTDGGVYDNLGLETAWKRYKTVLVSDAGGGFDTQGKPKRDWGRHSLRVLGLIDNQVRALRKRQVVGSYVDGSRTGAYWGIRTNIAHYELSDPLTCPPSRTLELANVKTRLKRLSNETQKRLINWGYAACDAALRKHHDPSLQPPPGFPYPNVGV